MEQSTKKYPLRPQSNRVTERNTDCKCTHAYHEHKRGLLSLLMIELPYVLYAGECEKCMCPHYKQSKEYFVFDSEGRRIIQ